MFTGAKLRELRKQKGFQSAEELAQKAEINTSILYSIENDKREPSLTEFLALSKALNVSILELLDVSSDEIANLLAFENADFLDSMLDNTLPPVFDIIADQYIKKHFSSMTFTLFYRMLKNSTEQDFIKGAYALLKQSSSNSVDGISIKMGDWTYNTSDEKLKDSFLRMIALHSLTPLLEVATTKEPSGDNS